jgi:hypothetical protein
MLALIEIGFSRRDAHMLVQKGYSSKIAKILRDGKRLSPALINQVLKK